MNVIFKKVLIIFLLLVMSITYVCVASSDSWISNIEDNFENEEETEASKSIKNVLDALIVGTKIVGVAVAIIMLITLGVKYMMAAPGDRADIKKSAIPFVVGAFILFAVSGILSIILKFSDNINS